MEFWEFLIQKEGDRSWLPLESPSVEILAGRYRVVARSSRANLATEVRVTHYAIAEQPPVRRVRKRSSQTNADGLIVILPFTRLQPGVWELRCTGDLMAEMMGENWHYVVQLEVVPAVVPLPVALLDRTDQAGDSITDPAATPIPTDSITAAEGAELDHPVVSTTASITAAESSVGASGLELAHPSGELTVSLRVDSIDSSEVDASKTEQESVNQESVNQESVNQESSGTGAANAEWVNSASSPDSTNPADLTEDQSYPTTALADVLQQVEQHSERVVDAAFRALADLEDLSEDRSAAASVLDAGQTGAALSGMPQLQVVLERETYIIQRGESVALAGRIEYLADPANDHAAAQVTVSELRVRLYDPQTSALLMNEVYPIGDRVPPFPFSGTVSLPEHYQTYLVLGELIFQGSAGGESQVLATRSFNVTTDLHELIESIANDFPDVEALPPEARIPEIAEPLPTSELARLNAQPNFQRSPQMPLPPQLRQPNPTRTHASLELPTFAKPAAPVEEPLSAPSPLSHTSEELTAAPLTEASTEQISTSATDLEPLESLPIATSAEAEADHLTALTDQSTDPPVASTSALSSDATGTPDDTTDLFPNWDEIEGRVPIWKQRQRSGDLSNAPEDVSFRALNLQERFWTRLQSLATNPELSATLGTEAAELSVGADIALAPLAHVAEMATRKHQSVGLDADLTAHEIVVDDESSPVAAPPDEPEVTETDPGLSPILPEDEPIPTPRLQLQTGELTADQPIQLTVKLPNLVARVYVKLWLRDRQTRELLGTPRWIIDFVPDGFGNQMARTEVIVPPGCLKVQFEAISVEIATQRESDKTTMTRPVVPPDLSPLSLDKLEI